jgi:hypothetical protein
MKIENTMITEISEHDAYYDCKEQVIGKNVSVMEVLAITDGWYGGRATFSRALGFGIYSIMLYRVKLKMTLQQRIKLLLWRILP